MAVRLIQSERNARKTRVAAYVRVSTLHFNQDESFEEQAAYYEHFICSNPEWEFAGVYGDQMSGTHVENREEFNRMVQDALNHKIDLIFCKSVSRWARNTVEALEKIKLLTGNQVDVVFEQENIDTRKAGVILQLSLAAAIAQSESESISENMKWTYRSRASMGIYIPRKGMNYGYNTDDGTFKPDQNARYVKLMFQMYADGASMYTIAEELNNRGAKTNKGLDWAASSVRSILKNEVYVGDYHFGKNPSRNVITGELDEVQYERYLENHHEGLVSRELWDRVQARFHDLKQQKKANSECRKRIARILLADPHINYRKLAEKLDISTDEVMNHVDAMRRHRWVWKENGCWVADIASVR